MAISIRPAIPADQLVRVIPSVLPAGGDALDLIGLMLTTNPRPPLGLVLRFADATDVIGYFGATSQEAALSTIYFNGPTNATAFPGALLIAQYPLGAVSAFLRGGFVGGLALTALQALNGSLSVTIDAVVKTATINLSAATSFSNAAEIIADALVIEGVPAATVTGSIGGTMTASAAGTVLTVSAVLTGSLQVGDVVSGTDGTNALPGGCSILLQLTGVAGGTGTYRLSAAPTPGAMSSTTVTSLSKVLDVTAVASGALGVGDQLVGSGITTGTYIASMIGATTGGTGLYTISVAHTVVSETINAFTPAVQYDPILGAFSVFSGTTGVTSTITFGSGALATSLRLTAATGAQLSQGALATDPATFMDAVIRQTQDWASFMTTWEPDDANKEAFATWTNGQNNRFVYEMWDTSVSNTQAGGPSPAVDFINTGGLSGIVMVHEEPTIDTVGGELAAFGMGWTASLDFTRLNGRATQAFKGQPGLAPQIFDGTVADYLISYGMNFYGDYTTANQAFIEYQTGTVSGPFVWKDSYVNQIWLAAQLQLSIMVGLQNTPAIPYNTAGYTLLEAFMMDAINEAVNFGAIVAGVTLSAEQIVEVNRAAGLVVDTIIFQRGWYLSILPAMPQVRRARGSPPCTLFYSDGGSIQRVILAAIEIQ